MLLICILFFISNNSQFTKKEKSTPKESKTYTVKMYKDGTYRGIYESSGYIELQDVNNNNLLVKDGEYVFNGEKITTDGVYAHMNGVFSKQEPNNRIYQGNGEVVFYATENNYERLSLGDQVKIKGINKKIEGEGTITEIAKQPSRSNNSSISKYRIAVQVQNPEKYFFGEHLLVTPISKEVYVPKEYVDSKNRIFVLGKNGKTTKREINPIEKNDKGSIYSVNDLPVGTKVKVSESGKAN